MLIREMKLHPIAIADPPLRSSYGLHAPFALRTIVELVSTDGLTGISETYGGDGPVAALEAARGQIVGSDPFQLTRLSQKLTGGANGHCGPCCRSSLRYGSNSARRSSAPGPSGPKRNSVEPMTRSVPCDVRSHCE